MVGLDVVAVSTRGVLALVRLNVFFVVDRLHADNDDGNFGSRRLAQHVGLAGGTATFLRERKYS